MDRDTQLRDGLGRRLALHACCGPCLIEPLDELQARDFRVTVVYFNPNIHPAEEYSRRRDTLADYASRQGVEVVELAYDPQRWHVAVAETSTREERCAACYRLRLDEVSRWAVQAGCDLIGTTLTISPYQDVDAISCAGERSAAEHGTEYLVTDFRDRYPSATRRSRDEDMYRQNYCGCLPSQAEAQAQRDARKAARLRARKEDRSRG